MALRIWLPLNGNYDNKGISGATTTSSSGNFNSAGVVTSKSWYTGIIRIPFTYTGTNQLSVALWLKPNTPDAWTSIFGWGHSNVSNRIEVNANGGTGYIYFGSNGLVAGSTQLTNSVTNLAWNHIALVADGTKVRFYANGVKTADVAQTHTVAESFAGNSEMVIGGYGDQFKGWYNDFRVYDHALSAKEVKELSQGLIAHYPMTGYGVDSLPNLFPFTNAYTKSSPYIHTLSARDGYLMWGEQSLVTVTPGETYYLSLHCDGIPGSHDVTGKAVTNNFTVWFYLRIIGTRQSIGGYDSAICFSSSNMYLSDPEHQLYVWKWTAPSNAQDITFRTNSYSNGSTSVTLKFWDLKVEKGAYTPFVPGSGQPAYTALGLNSSKLADTTGHGYDLTWSASPTVVSGSPRYMTATDFNAAAYASRSSFAISLSAFTVSFWFKPRTMTGNQHYIVGTFDNWTNNGIGIYRNWGTPRFIEIIVRSSTQSSYASCGGQISTLDEWHHLAITWDNTIINVYIDGTLTTTRNYSGGTCDNKNLYLGNSMYSSTPASETEECAMSDFRMYATALTADDITALYRAPVSFTDNGEVHACGIHELPGTNPVSVGKSGVVKAAAVSEIYGRLDNEVRIEPDGSAWVRMVHHGEPGPDNLFASGDSFATSVYKDSKRWFHGKICDYTDRWEFMVVQKIDSSSAATKFRWVQTKNPNNAAYADVPASSITKFTTSGYTNFSYGGIYRMTSNTYYAGNNSSSGNWMGAFGSWTTWSGGIPGWTAAVQPTGYLDLYIRLDGGANWSYPKNDRVSIVKTDNSLTEYGIVEI